MPSQDHDGDGDVAAPIPDEEGAVFSMITVTRKNTGVVFPMITVTHRTTGVVQAGRRCRAD